MNPLLPADYLERMREADPEAYRAEVEGRFRDDVASYVTREVIGACTIPDRRELPPASGVHYLAFVDPSGGSQDSMTLAIAHREGERTVLDLIRERRPPFSPDQVVEEYAATLKLYGCASINGDRYAGQWPRERFQKHGVHYVPSERNKSEIYAALLPLLNAQRVELLDDRRLAAQLLGLERRTSRGGRESIDHGPGGHDDLCNAAAGAIVLAADTRRVAPDYRNAFRRVGRWPSITEILTN